MKFKQQIERMFRSIGVIRVRVEKRSFGQLVTDDEFDLTIATARLGDKFMDVAGQIRKKWGGAQHILVAFGAPSRGLREIAKEEGAKLEAMVDFIVNMIPEQGTATVRTEEALLASLAILNVQFQSTKYIHSSPYFA